MSKDTEETNTRWFSLPLCQCACHGVSECMGMPCLQSISNKYQLRECTTSTRPEENGVTTLASLGLEMHCKLFVFSKECTAQKADIVELQDKLLAMKPTHNPLPDYGNPRHYSNTTPCLSSADMGSSLNTVQGNSHWQPVITTYWSA